MDSFSFQPTFDRLDPRLLPSVTPTEVYAAEVYTQAAAGVVRWQSQDMGTPHTQDQIDALAAYFPAVAQGTAAAAGVLAEFSSEVKSQTTPAPSTALDQLLAQIASMQAQSQVTAGYAQLYASTFAAQATPSAPPTDTPTDTTTDTPTIDASGMVSAMPSVNDPGWQTQADGLKVWDVRPGTGAAVTSSSTVSVYYTGWLAANGTKFDTNTTDATPMMFQVSGLIPGWQEGIVGMKVGGIRRLYVPAALGYGSTAQGPIPANSDLVFEVKLAGVA
jgi:FKBP-type peptidyl-prolyl cis-trans isomerase